MVIDMSEYIEKRLFELHDDNYREFHSRLIPNVRKDTIIGVRTTALRKLASELWKEGTAENFMKQLPHKYYEENNLHGFFIEKIGDYDKTTAALDKFLPYIDNWATCDLMSPKIFKKNTEKLLPKIEEWIKSGDTYTVRFGIGMLMKYYLDENFSPEILEIVTAVKSDEYYVNMMIAWFFATALAKQYDSSISIIENRKLDSWTHNKTIQKAAESNRISPEIKKYLYDYKVKL